MGVRGSAPAPPAPSCPWDAQGFPSASEFHKSFSHPRPMSWPHVLPTARPPCPSLQLPDKQPSEQETALERAGKSFTLGGIWGQTRRRSLPSGVKLSLRWDDHRWLGDGCWVLLPAPLRLKIPAQTPHPCSSSKSLLKFPIPAQTPHHCSNSPSLHTLPIPSQILHPCSHSPSPLRLSIPAQIPISAHTPHLCSHSPFLLTLPIPSQPPHPHQALEHSTAPFPPAARNHQAGSHLHVMAARSCYHCCCSALTHIDILVQRLIITGYS